MGALLKLHFLIPRSKHMLWIPKKIRLIEMVILSTYDVASGSEITPSIKIDTDFRETLLTSRIWQNPNVFTPK